MNKMAYVTDAGDIKLRLSAGNRRGMPVESAEILVRDIQSAIAEVELRKAEALRKRPMPTKPFKAILRFDLKDSYGDIYYSKGETVTVSRHHSPDCAIYPFQIGGFYVDATAFDPIKK